MKILFRYLLIFSILGISALYLLDNLFLPILINSNEEVYIPDVRNLSIYNKNLYLLNRDACQQMLHYL